MSRLNSSPEALLVVALDTVRLVTTMKEAWAQTGGRYDPTLLGAINALGYATSVDGSGRRSSRPRGPRAGRGPRRGPRAPQRPARVGAAGRRLGPGRHRQGSGRRHRRARTARAPARPARSWASGATWPAPARRPPHGWRVAVEDPLDRSRTLATVALAAGGRPRRARSRARGSTTARTSPRRRPVHRQSASTDLAAVTVFARAGWEAEAHATAALLAGSRGALDLSRAGRPAGDRHDPGRLTTPHPGLASAGETEWSAA